MARAFLGAKSAQLFIKLSISLTLSCNISSGVDALANSAGVTMLTRASVHCADRRTAIRRV